MVEIVSLFEGQKTSYLKYYKTLSFIIKIYKIKNENYLLVTFYDNLLNEISVPKHNEYEEFSNGNSVIKYTLLDMNSYLILYPNKYNLYYKKECICLLFQIKKRYYLDFK